MHSYNTTIAAELRLRLLRYLLQLAAVVSAVAVSVVASAAAVFAVVVVVGPRALTHGGYVSQAI